MTSMGLVSCRKNVTSVKPPPTPGGTIVSMAPNITEILFDLGLGDRVVGVTRFCNYPEAARAKEKIGGFLDPNYEAIVSLSPDRVVLLASQAHVEKKLVRLGLETLSVPHETVADILAAIRQIGAACDVAEKAEHSVGGMEAALRDIQEKTAGRPRPTVLVSLGRDLSLGGIHSVTAAGHHNFYHELISLAGGRNVCTADGVAYPLISVEGLLHLNPEVIIDLVGSLEGRALQAGDAKKHWDSLPQLKAVAAGRICVLTSDAVMRPGPRMVAAARLFARCLHPDLDWGD